MTIHVIRWLEGQRGRDGRHDGGSTRRTAIISALAKRLPVKIIELVHRGGISSYLRALGRFIPTIERLPSSCRILLFYPDFPFFHPPAEVKIPFLRVILWRLSAARRRGITVVIDAVDLPRWQAPSLGYSLRLPSERLRLCERSMSEASDWWIVPTESLAALFEEDLDLPEGFCRCLPNGLDLECFPSPCLTLEGRPAFLYLGDCRRDGGRPLEWLVQGFLRHASPEARLHLAGEGGEWLRSGYGDGGRVTWWGYVTEDEALSLASAADFGLIPYPEEGYFKWCHPSKVGLYRAAGLPMISTNLDETARFLQQAAAGFVRPWKDFPKVFGEGEQLLTMNAKDVFRRRIIEDRSWGDRVIDVLTRGGPAC